MEIFNEDEDGEGKEYGLEMSEISKKKVRSVSAF